MTMPPGHSATVGQLKTFTLPNSITGSRSDRELGKQMLKTWRSDGIFQISVTLEGTQVLDKAYRDSKAFFKLPYRVKADHVDSQSFSGYIASGEELTDGIADFSEIFTVTKDLPQSDRRVEQGWPGHGPCPWPSKGFESTMKDVMHHFGESGKKLLKLVALGLGLKNIDFFSELTDDGWHHMRILRFPQLYSATGDGRAGRGIGSHTDYGLLVIASQDDVGGLFIRPPIQSETIKNWEKSAAGFKEDDDKWKYVPPATGVFTVFPGDMMQYLTNSYLSSTPHKVGLNFRERFAFAYFHEPNFSAVVRPLEEFADLASKEEDGIQYGTHFTNMFLRSYPNRITSRRIMEENRMDILKAL